MIKFKFNMASVRRIFQGSSIIMGMSRKVTKGFLRRFGGYVRTVAKNSLGKPGKVELRIVRSRGRTTGRITDVSLPGHPPYSRTKMLKNSIRFDADMSSRSVIMGPVLLRVTKKVAGKVPPLLEYGGTTQLLMGKQGSQRWKKAHYRARPFMGPAFEKTLPKRPLFWQQARQDVLKG